MFIQTTKLLTLFSEFTNVIEVLDWIGADEFIRGGNSLEEIQIFGATVVRSKWVVC